MPERQNADHDDAQQREHPMAALLLMLSRFPLAPSQFITHSIAAHLQIVANDARFAEPVRQAASQACSEWRAMIRMQAELERLRLRVIK